ncbi:hypothetical protein O181_083131 [Austropuccinia psidii MF-1]|uniref:Uncharacterized protein n=1 Tax=Austropuccinia psidii MF-1 TaxID=1389203 RepID=A0A9Q3IHL4_9BASI|nr:hypothetical protein [Austropuccinia psidii MF-1]
MEIQDEAEDEHIFILTREEFPWEGYRNWLPLRNANLVDYNNNNPRNNYECENQHVKWLEDSSKPKNNKLERINRKICPSLQAHLAWQYQVSTQKEDWTENRNRNENIIQDYFDENEDFQDQYFNEERRNELTAKKAKFKKNLDNKFS